MYLGSESHCKMPKLNKAHNLRFISCFSGCISKYSTSKATPTCMELSWYIRLLFRINSCKAKKADLVVVYLNMADRSQQRLKECTADTSGSRQTRTPDIMPC